MNYNYSTEDMFLVYESEAGKKFLQPYTDIVDSGTMIDPDTDEDMQIVGWTTGAPPKEPLDDLDYVAQMALSPEDMLNKVEEYVGKAKAMHWDECHKIYLSMDAETVESFNSLGYATHLPDSDKIMQWYEHSCSLKFIQVVRSGGSDNEDYSQLIPQAYEGFYSDEDN